MTNLNFTVRKEGELKTPWDECYKQSLIRTCPIPTQAPMILDFGVNYFILKLEAIELKTFWSCEGHPSGFYIVFKAPYKIARKISFMSSEFAQVSISNITKSNIKHTAEKLGKIESRRNLCWNLDLNSHGGSYECRNALLRGLSIVWEKYL
jgi:hypothetical protein